MTGNPIGMTNPHPFRRMLATAIDVGIANVLVQLFTGTLVEAVRSPEDIFAVRSVIGLVGTGLLWFSMSTLSEYWFSRTIGKYVAGLRIGQTDHSRIRVRQAADSRITLRQAGLHDIGKTIEVVSVVLLFLNLMNQNAELRGLGNKWTRLNTIASR